MRIYRLNTTFNFGKYKGKSLRNILAENPYYIEWCILNINSFIIPQVTADEIKNVFPRFLSSEISMKIFKEKLKKYNLEAWMKYLEEDEEEEEKTRELNRNYDKRGHDYNYEESNWDNEYYDDGLDLDQQSPEWWDSL